MIDTLDALKPDKPAVVSLDEESLLGNRFQVIPARYDSKGILQIAVFNLELVADTKKSNFLFLGRRATPPKSSSKVRTSNWIKTYSRLKERSLRKSAARSEQSGSTCGRTNNRQTG